MHDGRVKPIDLQVSLLLDGELTDNERTALEALLQQDPQARARLEELRLCDERARKSFEDMLKEPVSLDLVRSIRTATPPRRAVRLPGSTRPRLPVKPSVTAIIATSLVMFALGTSAGYMFAGRPGMMTYADLAGDPNKAWLDDVASHYRLFSRQSRHLVEVPAIESAHIVDWLMATTGISFRIPDLSKEGLQFLGARLYSAGGRPVGQLIYRNSESEVIAISFTKSIAPSETGMREVIRDDIGLVVWQGLQASYVLTGPSADAMLDTLASKVAGII